MSYIDDLSPASFRGVPFEVEGGEVTGGRRVSVHEYPQRDKPYPEDNGRSGRRFSIVGFVIGADWLEKSDALIEACEKAGPGTLVHPWRGSIKVQPQGITVSYEGREAGVVRVTMTFVEAADIAFPASTANSTQKALGIADGAKVSVVSDFSNDFTVSGVPDFVLSEASEAVRTVSEALSVDPSGISMTDPGAISSFLLDAVDASAIDMTSYSLQPAPAFFETPSRLVAAKNVTALSSLVRRGGIIKKARGAVLADYEVYDYAVAERSSIQLLLDSEAVSGARDVYRSLSDLRIAASKAISEKAVKAKRLETVNFDGVRPALVEAYDRYEDASRADEIVSRNRVNHPGFMLGGVKVLSS